jgi:hypothetical protein
MTLEITLELWAVKRLLEAGANPIKYGQDGLPDRMVLWGGGAHFWIEFKKAKTGKLRPAQKVWKKYLTRIGDMVYVINSRVQVEEVIAAWEWCYGPAKAHRVLRAPDAR